MKLKNTPSNPATQTIRPAFRFILIAIVTVLTFIFFAQKIYFVNADLGRHIENGKIFFQNWKPISTNYYSYTEPDFPTINHHWGSGVVFYLLYKTVGFEGLSIFYCLVSSLTVLLFYLVAEKRSHSYLAFLFFMICIPLIAYRVEIRPELLSMLLLGIYVFLFEGYKDGSIPFKRVLIIIPLLQLVWVNLHIFFVFGLFLIAVYGINYLLNRKKGTIKKFTLLFGVSVIACLINPAGIRGALVPFSIFNNYAYMIAENQSILFSQKRFGNTVFLHFEIATLIVLILALLLLYRNRFILKKYAAELICMLVFSVIAFSAVRGIPDAACFFLAFAPILSFAFIKSFVIKIQKNIFTMALICSLILLTISTVNSETYLSAFKQNTGFGLDEATNNSVTFFKSAGIRGPIFNNYDIGGYLIFGLFPQERVFVDNRPEAYSKKFFEETYNPVLESDTVWKKVDSTFHFNCIYFYRLDETQFGQPFLIRRISDTANWAPVYVDAATLILLRRTKQNQPIIQEFELLRDMFHAKDQ